MARSPDPVKCIACNCSIPSALVWTVEIILEKRRRIVEPGPEKKRICSPSFQRRIWISLGKMMGVRGLTWVNWAKIFLPFLVFPLVGLFQPWYKAISLSFPLVCLAFRFPPDRGCSHAPTQIPFRMVSCLNLLAPIAGNSFYFFLVQAAKSCFRSLYSPFGSARRSLPFRIQPFCHWFPTWRSTPGQTAWQ